MLSHANYQIGSVHELGIEPASVREFISTHWNREIALSVADFYDWQFLAPPDNAAQDHCLLVLDENRDIQGFMGLNQRLFHLGDKLLHGAELTTWMHTDKARGPVAMLVLKSLQQQYDVLMGSGLSQAAWPLYAQFGFKTIRRLPRFVRVYRWKELIDCSQISDTGKRLIRLADSHPPVLHRAEAASTSDLVDVASSFHRDYNGFSRSPSHLAWRYEHHPYFDYKIFRVTQGSHGGAVVLRVDKKSEFSFIHVIEILGPDALLPAMVSFIDGFAKSTGVAFADFSGTSPRVYSALWNRGWSSILDEPAIQVPNLFYPLELREPPTTSVTMWSRENMGELLNLGRLYFSKGDCDLDRPTMAFLREQGLNQELGA
jgi:hypothetical protein